ncbi:MAG: outer membrane protein transport protein [Bdellovibrionales bacterium]|nr:outer membrane protein transport protein [Bdellovibrionales bacterium]
MRNNSFVKTLGLCAAFVMGAQAGAAGFEKSIMFGGKTSGIAGIGTPQMQGADALYFNPAGLATDKVGHEVTLNVSPTWPKFKAPVASNDTQMTSETVTVLPASLMYQHSLNEDWGLGIGLYSSGGTEAKYDNISLSPLVGTPVAKAELQVIELALGAGYKISDAWKVGVSYRIINATGEFGFLSPYPPPSYAGVANTILKDVNGTNYAAFKVGAQYKMSESTTLGFTYRSDAQFKAKAKADLNVHAGSLTPAAKDADVKLLATLPDAYTIGVKHVLSENWNLYGEYVYTVYSRMQTAQIEGKIAALNNPAIEFGWKDQTNVRLAGEYLGLSAPIRFGYIYTSAVTDKQFAKAYFAPPGPAHTLTLGSGMNFGETMSLNGGLEYTWASADAGTSPKSVGTKTGTYAVTEYALHVGLSYGF